MLDRERDMKITKMTKAEVLAARVTQLIRLVQDEGYEFCTETGRYANLYIVAPDNGSTVKVVID
jgi:hypothetical protein